MSILLEKAKIVGHYENRKLPAKDRNRCLATYHFLAVEACLKKGDPSLYYQDKSLEELKEFVKPYVKTYREWLNQSVSIELEIDQLVKEHKLLEPKNKVQVGIESTLNLFNEWYCKHSHLETFDNLLERFLYDSRIPILEKAQYYFFRSAIKSIDSRDKSLLFDDKTYLSIVKKAVNRAKFLGVDQKYTDGGDLATLKTFKKDGTYYYQKAPVRNITDLPEGEFPHDFWDNSHAQFLIGIQLPANSSGEAKIRLAVFLEEVENNYYQE